jgi:hypothetical protein
VSLPSHLRRLHVVLAQCCSFAFVCLRVPAPSCAFTSCLCSGSAPFVAFTLFLHAVLAVAFDTFTICQADAQCVLRRLRDRGLHRDILRPPSRSFARSSLPSMPSRFFGCRIARHSPFVAFTIAYPEPSPSSPSRFFGRAHESAFVAFTTGNLSWYRLRRLFTISSALIATDSVSTFVTLKQMPSGSFVAFTIVSVREAVVPSSPSSRSPAVSFRTPQTIERVPLRHLHVFWPVGLSAGRPSFAFTILCQLSLAVSRLRRSTSTVAQTLRRPMPSMPSLLPASPRVWSAAFDAFTIFRVDTAGLYLRRLHDSVNCPRSVWLDFPSSPSRSFLSAVAGLSAIGHVDEATLRSPSRRSRSNVRSGNLRRLHDLSSVVAGGFSLLRRLHDLLSACRIRASDGSRLVRSFDGLHDLLSAVASRATASSFPPTPSRRDQTLTNLPSTPSRSLVSRESRD